MSERMVLTAQLANKGYDERPTKRHWIRVTDGGWVYSVCGAMCGGSRVYEEAPISAVTCIRCMRLWRQP